MKPERIQERFQDIDPAWKLDEREPMALVRRFPFKSWEMVLTFVSRVREVGRWIRHQPIFQVNGHDVDLRLFTQDAGTLSEKDFDLAELIDDKV